MFKNLFKSVLINFIKKKRSRKKNIRGTLIKKFKKFLTFLKIIKNCLKVIFNQFDAVFEKFFF
jgi:hypothetical protein